MKPWRVVLTDPQTTEERIMKLLELKEAQTVVASEVAEAAIIVVVEATIIMEEVISEVAVEATTAAMVAAVATMAAMVVAVVMKVVMVAVEAIRAAMEAEVDINSSRISTVKEGIREVAAEVDTKEAMASMVSLLEQHLLVGKETTTMNIVEAAVDSIRVVEDMARISNGNIKNLRVNLKINDLFRPKFMSEI